MFKDSMTKHIVSLLILGATAIPSWCLAADEHQWSHQASCKVRYNGINNTTGEFVYWEDVLPPINLANTTGSEEIFFGDVKSRYLDHEVQLNVSFSDPKRRSPIFSLGVIYVLEGKVISSMRTFESNVNVYGDYRFFHLYVDLEDPSIVDLIEKSAPDRQPSPIEAAKTVYPQKEIVILDTGITCSTSTIKKEIID